MPPALQFLVLTFAGWVNRHQDDLIAYLREENRVLREHLGPRPLRLTDAQRRRLAVRGQKLGRRVLMQVAGIVTPDTILRWYRRLIAQTYAGSARRGRGRPMTRRDVAALVVRMAVENPQWGYTRIRGALSNLGHEIARTTVKRILHDHGIDPAPERSRRMPWKTFLQAHGEGLTACDLFTVEVLTLAGLQRYLVFFVIALQSRRVTIAGIHPQPYGTWMEQMARNLTDHPPPLVAAERPLLVVVRHDVLTELRADGLEPVADVPDDREIPEDRVLALQQVVHDDDGQEPERAEEQDHRVILREPSPAMGVISSGTVKSLADTLNRLCCNVGRWRLIA